MKSFQRTSNMITPPGTKCNVMTMVTTSTPVSSDDSLLDGTSILVQSPSVIQSSYKCQSLEIPAPIWLSGTPLQAPAHSSYSPTTVSGTQHD